MIIKVNPAASTAMVTAERDRRLEAMAGAYSPSERETWSVQIAEAKALADDPDAPAPLLRALVSDDATALAALATRVLGLADAFAAASGAIMRAHNVLVAMDPIPADYADDKHWP